MPPSAWDTVDSWDKSLKVRFVKTCRLVSVDLAYPSLRTEKIKGPGGEPLLRPTNGIPNPAIEVFVPAGG